mmetsp:Transcript_72329/g.161921  ORF Transcript_72329/g.161921 Transcript_72329/m.161921 type:complete len:662 (-) Transcript_72329:107-2092(-)
MALGSSAPEILLSLNDIMKQEFFSGKLGPSTIVGSAAFNLFVIIAVCINSIPDGEVRKIKETNVFFITAAFSIFAYVWVLYIVNFHSRNVIEVSEGVMTLMFFPVLITISYAADVGYLSRDNFMRLMRCEWPRKKDHVPGVEDEAGGRLGRKLCSAACRVMNICKFFARRGAYKKGALDDLEHGELLAEAFDPQAPLLDESGSPLECEAGILTFKSDALTVVAGTEPQELSIPVFRKNGSGGRISCKFRTEMLTATPNYDFEETEGELNYRDGIVSQDITLTILPKVPGHLDDAFQLVIEDAEGGAEFNPDADGGPERCLMTVTIVNEHPATDGIRNNLRRLLDYMVNTQEAKLGFDEWKHQVIQAIVVQASSDAEDAQPSCGDKIMHWIWFPWQLTFALLTPPPTFIGGWICFWFSLLHIAWLTVIIGDFAELFGCSAGVEDEITAISFVALGTSVPDLFASRTAAKQDEWADASIVNVTGSNSVNVFLGIGLPWMAAAFYWRANPDHEGWLTQYGGSYTPGSFVVKGGNLAYSVAVFTLAALCCLACITLRRYAFGGELGGQSDTKAYSSFFLILLWFAYLTLSVWQIVTQPSDVTMQILSMVIALVVIGVMMVMFALFRQLLKVSKKYIGEEGFWGIFVAMCIIGGRMVIFLMFQYTW